MTASSIVFAQQGPFPHRIQHPVYLQTVTILPSRAQVLDPGTLEIRNDSAYSNIFEQASSSTFNVNLDMELWRAGWKAAYGFLPGWEVGLEISTLHFEGGFLDGFIQNYHDFFGFPNGGRGTAPNGTFAYSVTQNGTTLVNVTQRAFDAGDLTLTAKNQVLIEEGAVPALAWIFALKFPSGDADFGLGSGNVGFGLGVAAEKSYKKLHGYLNLNYLVDGGNESLEGLTHKVFFDFSAAAEWSFSQRISALVQLVGSTPRLKGADLEIWDGVPLDLVIGTRGSIGRGEKFFWLASFSEDVRAVGPSVDFTVSISAGLRFPGVGFKPYRGDFLASR